MSEPDPVTGNGAFEAHGESSGLLWAVASHAGKVRDHNEDWAAAWLPSPDDQSRTPLFVVCDGLGGHAAGEVASRAAAGAMLRNWGSGTGRGAQALRSAARAANVAVYDAAAESGHRGMATTLTGLALGAGQAQIAHVGDSRCYHVRGSTCAQVTADHSRVGEMLRLGLLSPEQAANHPARSQLTRAVGTEPVVQIDIVRMGVRVGDLFLLCSDGLWDLVARHELVAATAAADVATMASDLVMLALEREAPDNVTVVIVKVASLAAGAGDGGRRSLFRRGRG